jgi:hypothetical protein
VAGEEVDGETGEKVDLTSSIIKFNEPKTLSASNGGISTLTNITNQLVTEDQPPVATPWHQQKGLHTRNSLSPSAPALTSPTKACPRPHLAYLSAVHDQAVIKALVVEPSPLTPVVQPTTPPEVSLAGRKPKKNNVKPTPFEQPLIVESSHHVHKLTDFGMQHATQVEGQKEKVEKAAQRRMEKQKVNDEVGSKQKSSKCRPSRK